MQTYEYKVVPALNRSKRVKGVKTVAGRFAALLSDTMNEQAKDGWEYLRSDSLPVEEKPGLLKSKVENYHTMLVFRRPMPGVQPQVMAGYIEDQSDTAPLATEPAAAPVAAPVAEAHVEPEPQPAPEYREEPSVTPGWADADRFPQDPPMTAPQSDSPFAEPTDTDDQIAR